MILLALALALQTSPWLVDDVTSPIDGKRSFIAGVESTTTVLNTIGRPEKAMLAVSCADGRRRVVLQWPAFLGRDEVQVTWKVNDGDVRTDRFSVADGTSAVLSGRGADRFLSSMSNEGQAFIRVRGYRDEQETTFDLKGAAAPLATLQEACPA